LCFEPSILERPAERVGAPDRCEVCFESENVQNIRQRAQRYTRVSALERAKRWTRHPCALGHQRGSESTPLPRETHVPA
jgi:hypothetical protein